MTDAEKLRDLAEQLDGLEYLTCVGSGDLCRCVADEIELAYARIDSLLDSLLKANVALSENAGKVRELQDEIERLKTERDACIAFIENEMHWCHFRDEFTGDNVSVRNARKLAEFLDKLEQ